MYFLLYITCDPMPSVCTVILLLLLARGIGSCVSHAVNYMLFILLIITQQHQMNLLYPCIFVDQNECNSNNGGCSHKCVNTFGSFKCKCPPRMKVTADRRTCAQSR